MSIDYRELRKRIRLEELLQRIGWESTEGRGDQLRGPCPLPGCQARRTNGRGVTEARALSIHVTKNLYRCFHCGSAGNALDFWRAYRNTTLHAAARELYEILETSNRTSPPKQPPTR